MYTQLFFSIRSFTLPIFLPMPLQFSSFRKSFSLHVEEFLYSFFQLLWIRKRLHMSFQMSEQEIITWRQIRRIQRIWQNFEAKFFKCCSRQLTCVNCSIVQQEKFNYFNVMLRIDSHALLRFSKLRRLKS